MDRHFNRVILSKVNLESIVAIKPLLVKSNVFIAKMVIGSTGKGADTLYKEY